MRKKVSVLVEKYTCEKRYLDANKVKDYFLQNNYIIVNNPKKSDIIFFITCAASEIQAEFSLEKIRELKKYKAELIVGGCLPGIDEKKLRDVFSGRIIITKDMSQLDALFPENKIKYKEIMEAHTLASNLDLPIYNEVKQIFHSSKDVLLRGLLGKKSYLYSELAKTTFYYLTCSTGCLGSCSYCSIKKATGSLVSKKLDRCMNEFATGLKAGYTHFKVVGDDVGAYGMDIDETFPTLLDKMTRVPGDYEITVQSIHPQWMVKYIDDIENILKRGKVVHLAVLIQSASPRILRMMNRYSEIEKIRNAFARLRTAYPELKINTHCIVGFPSETMAEFKETLAFINDFNLSGFIFFFSERPNTRALELEPKITDEEKMRRLNYAKHYLRKRKYHVLFVPSKKIFIFDTVHYGKDAMKSNTVIRNI